MNIELSIVIAILTLVATAAAAWGAAKVALNGAKQNISILRAKVEAHIDDEVNHDLLIIERLIKLEVIMDRLAKDVAKNV